MRVLGVDPGTTTAGCCHLDFPTNAVLAKGVLAFADLRKFIKKHRKEIDMIAVERPLIYNRCQPGTTENLAIMLREVGRLEQIGEQYRIPVVLITRADILLMLTGRRPSRSNKVSKKQCQDALMKQMNHSEPIRPQHASDAGAAAWTAWTLSQPTEAHVALEEAIA